MKVFKLIFLWLFVAVSAIFDKSRYSAFDIICFMALFWVADAWMESSPPSGFFYLSLVVATTLIGIVSGFLNAAFNDLKKWLGAKNV